MASAILRETRTGPAPEWAEEPAIKSQRFKSQMTKKSPGLDLCLQTGAELQGLRSCRLRQLRVAVLLLSVHTLLDQGPLPLHLRSGLTVLPSGPRTQLITGAVRGCPLLVSLVTNEPT